MCEKQSEVKGVITADILANEVASIIYCQGKAKVCNLLEAQLSPDYRLNAAKRILEDMLTQITKDVAHYIINIVGDIEIPIVGGGTMTEEEEKEAQKQYNEIEDIIR